MLRGIALWVAVASVLSSTCFADENPFLRGSCPANNVTHFIGNYPTGLFPSGEMIEALQGPIGAISVAPSDSALKVCSGVLITPDYFLTAYHCLFLHAPIQNKFVSFNFQMKNGKSTPQSHFAVERVLYSGNLPAFRDGYDYAILKLSGKPGNQFGYVPIHKREVVNFGETIFSIHHPGNLHKAVSIGNILNANAAPNFPGLNEYKYFTSSNLTTAQGSSGGPVFDSFRRLIGLNTMGNCSKQFAFTDVMFPLSMQNAFLKLSSLMAINPVIKKLSESGYSPDDPLLNQ